MGQLNLVMGGNGHLGNNLVRMLLEKGERVRVSVRNSNNRKAFSGLDCEIVGADLLDKNSLIKAMEDVDIVYDAAAVYKSWAKDIPKEIIRVNIEGTRNTVEAAAIQNVKKLIYISTSHALDLNRVPLDENTWNQDYADPSYIRKLKSRPAHRFF